MLGGFVGSQLGTALQPFCANISPSRGRSAFVPAGLQGTERTPGKQNLGSLVTV